MLSRAGSAQKQALSGSQLLGCAGVHVAVYQRGCVFSLLSSSLEYSGTVRGKTSPVLVPSALAGGVGRARGNVHTHPLGAGPGRWWRPGSQRSAQKVGSLTLCRAQSPLPTDHGVGEEAEAAS